MDIRQRQLDLLHVREIVQHGLAHRIKRVLHGKAVVIGESLKYCLADIMPGVFFHNRGSRISPRGFDRSRKNAVGGFGLERFDQQRRLVTLETIQKTTIQNKKNLESPGDEFRLSLQAIAADPARTREYLMRVSMIASLSRAEELG